MTGISKNINLKNILLMMNEILIIINDIQESLKKEIYKKHGEISTEEINFKLESWNKYKEIKEKLLKCEISVDIDESFKNIELDADQEYEDVKIAFHSIASKRK
ncbi:hypothetical protein DMUE_1984 [Dictyocoela muelleri]|nr:hypothetical protein DMUE_1984 [Dictyocoela muelleri]